MIKKHLHFWAAALMLAACSETPESIEHPPLDPSLDEPAPRSVVTSMNINPDANAGPAGSALYILNPNSGALEVHPLSLIHI